MRAFMASHDIRNEPTSFSTVSSARFASRSTSRNSRHASMLRRSIEDFKLRRAESVLLPYLRWPRSENSRWAQEASY
jgi:hypothetical protein